MKATATHPKFSEWETQKFELDYAPEQRGNAVMIKGQLFGGAMFFPLSCVNVNGFSIEVPTWLLRKNGYRF